MLKSIHWLLAGLSCFVLFGCTNAEEIISVCAKGKIIDYSCGRIPVVQVLTPHHKIGIKATINNATTEIENVIQVLNLPAEFNKPGKEFYFTFRLAKEEEKDSGPCLAIYPVYNVPQMFVNHVSELPCPDNLND